MATDSLTLTQRFPIPPGDLLARWLDAVWHARFTGGAGAEIDAGQGEMYRSGWEDHYFVHMREVLTSG